MAPDTRLASPADVEFLFSLFHADRAREFAGLPWSADQLEMFLRQQFDFQQRSFASTYSVRHDEIVEVGDRPIGRLLWALTDHAIVLVDLALVPEFRGVGIGTQLLRRVQTLAEEASLPLELQVRFDNPAAQRLYERLGFRVTADSGASREMRWAPPHAVGATAQGAFV